MKKLFKTADIFLKKFENNKKFLWTTYILNVLISIGFWLFTPSSYVPLNYVFSFILVVTTIMFIIQDFLNKHETHIHEFSYMFLQVATTLAQIFFALLLYLFFVKKTQTKISNIDLGISTLLFSTAFVVSAMITTLLFILFFMFIT